MCYGAILLGSSCLCIEIDKESIKTAKKFFEENSLDADFLVADVSNLSLSRKVDTVIQNPPFGVVKRSSDIIFLRKAMEIGNVVYTIHKSNPESRKLIERVAREYNYNVEFITVRYDLKPYYPWHREKVHKFLVDIYILKRNFS